MTFTDWFVSADAKWGDGSRDQPFHDPWLALRAAAPGDVIHIAVGTYYGRYDRSSWIVACPTLTLRGGYTHDFSERSPWETPSVFASYQGYEATREYNFITGRGDHSGLILDGLFFDASGSNIYAKPGGGILRYPAMDGPIASFNGREVTIQNCSFANCATGGVELSGDGSRFTNNLVVNIIGPSMLSIRTSSGGVGQPIEVTQNTFCFAHDVGDPPVGTGADRAIGIRLERAGIVRDNVFVSCGNAAIELYRDPDRVSLDRNLFFVTPRSVVTSRMQSMAELAEKDLEELEDLGLKSVLDNVIANPGLTGLSPQWLDTYSCHLLSRYARPPFEAANVLRVAAGLTTLSREDVAKLENKGDLAPRFSPADALAIRLSVKQGAHPVTLEAHFTGQSRAPAATYHVIDWTAVETPDPSLSHQLVELRAGLGLEQNTVLLPDASSTTHMGIRIFRPSFDEFIYVLAPRYTLASRQFEEAIKYNSGLDVENTYLLRGTYRTDLLSPTRQNVTLVLEAIVSAPLIPRELPARPGGRDWFVRAGASGGDGSRENPFRDPFQALERVQGGDSIHVSEGEYFGKLRSGKWSIPVRNLTMLGGYNADFTERDPWNRPVRFVLSKDEKAKGISSGTILASEGNCEGLILDGFLFDGASYNAYAQSGSLEVNQAPTGPQVSLSGGRALIVVRNCLFINASGEGVHISCPYGQFENNVVLNTNGRGLTINAGGSGPWLVRNNTLLFASDPTPRAGTGQSSDGTLLQLTGRATMLVQSNIFVFADNFGVRCGLPLESVSFQDNVFAGHLFIFLTNEQYLYADRSTWDRRAVADPSFAMFQGNTFDLPKLAVDPSFGDAALARLFSIPSRVTTQEWITLAGQLGSSVAPPPAQTAGPATPVAAPPEPPKAITAAGSSLSSLLSALSATRDRDKRAEEEVLKVSSAAEPVYCPVFDWKKALALVLGSGVDQPGARPLSLSVSFGPVREEEKVQYECVTPQDLDVDQSLLDNKPIELDVTELRDSTTNPSLYPAGTSKQDYAALSVVTLGESIRTRLAIVVKLDTQACKVIARAGSRDTLRVRGIARSTGGPHALSILVDAAEILEG